jgi:hypothetical protein
LGEVGSITFTKCYDRAVFIQNGRENDQLWTLMFDQLEGKSLSKNRCVDFPNIWKPHENNIGWWLKHRTKPLYSAGYPAGARSTKHHVSQLSIKPYPCTGWCRPVMWMLV